jgi:type III secretion protein J
VHRHPLVRTALLLFGLAAILLLGGCEQRVSLYSQVEENQANLMMALLLRMGINCDKEAGTDGFYNLTVDSEDFPAAVNILNYFGYPMQDSKVMADLMKSQGIISSPSAEATRQNLALADELSKTISRINGILSAQVFIVFGTNENSESSNASSASVFIKYREGFPIDKEIPKIKDLVLNSVLGLELTNVSVLTFASREWDYTDATGIVGFEHKHPSIDWQDWVLPAILLALGATGVGVALGRRYLAGRPSSSPRKA